MQILQEQVNRVVYIWKVTTAQAKLRKPMSESKRNTNDTLIVIECLKIRITKMVRDVEPDGSGF
jgi:hypothetical protein